jgi:hypothetical protein
MIDAAQLIASGQAAGKPPAWIAYTMVEPKPWGLGYCAFVAQRWHEVGSALGVEITTELRPLFREQFNERCAAFVRERFKV